MKKFILLCGILGLLLADDYQKALEYEKNKDYENAMKIYKKLLLKNSTNLTNNKPLKPEISNENKTLNSKLLNEKEKLKNEAKEKTNFAKLGLQNYLGSKQSFNPLGISSYKMNYFLPFSHSFNELGKNWRKNEAKFQISVKKELFENLLNMNEKYYIGYTQTSWWQFYNHSSPFRENNYQPEFFVDFPLNFKDYAFNNLRFGILHESNGKGDENLESRSWNRIYFSSVFLYENFLFVPRVWYRLPENDDDNPAMVHYMGIFDVNLGYLGKDYFVNILLRNNLKTNKNKGAIQVDVGYDIFNNGIFWYLQYFNGYGESLINYNKCLQRLSTGFLISY